MYSWYVFLGYMYCVLNSGYPGFRILKCDADFLFNSCLFLPSLAPHNAPTNNAVTTGLIDGAVVSGIGTGKYLGIIVNSIFLPDDVQVWSDIMVLVIARSQFRTLHDLIFMLLLLFAPKTMKSYTTPDVQLLQSTRLSEEHKHWYLHLFLTLIGQIIGTVGWIVRPSLLLTSAGLFPECITDAVKNIILKVPSNCFLSHIFAHCKLFGLQWPVMLWG